MIILGALCDICSKLKIIVLHLWKQLYIYRVLFWCNLPLPPKPPPVGQATDCLPFGVNLASFKLVSGMENSPAACAISSCVPAILWLGCLKEFCDAKSFAVWFPHSVVVTKNYELSVTSPGATTLLLCLIMSAALA